MVKDFEAGKTLGYTAAGYGAVEIAASEGFQNTIGDLARDVAGSDININSLEGTELGQGIENIIDIGAHQVAPTVLLLATMWIGFKKMLEGFKSDKSR